MSVSQPPKLAVARHAVADEPAEVLVERLGAAEHVVHIGHLLDVPAADVLVERLGLISMSGQNQLSLSDS